jgi:hypothetical protein
VRTSTSSTPRRHLARRARAPRAIARSVLGLRAPSRAIATGVRTPNRGDHTARIERIIERIVERIVVVRRRRPSSTVARTHLGELAREKETARRGVAREVVENRSVGHR